MRPTKLNKIKFTQSANLLGLGTVNESINDKDPVLITGLALVLALGTVVGFLITIITTQMHWPN